MCSASELGFAKRFWKHYPGNVPSATSAHLNQQRFGPSHGWQHGMQPEKQCVKSVSQHEIQDEEQGVTQPQMPNEKPT